MNIQGWGEIALTLGLAVMLGWPIGVYMSRVWNGERTWLDPVLKPVEAVFYGAAGVDPMARAETLSVDDFVRLARAVADGPDAGQGPPMPSARATRA